MKELTPTPISDLVIKLINSVVSELFLANSIVTIRRRVYRIAEVFEKQRSAPFEQKIEIKLYVSVLQPVVKADCL